LNKFIIVIITALSTSSFGQSASGVSGLIQVPNARILEDEKLVIGGSFIPKGFHPRTYGQMVGSKINPGLNTYILYSILPFVEVMFRYSHELNLPVNTETLYFPDRMFSMKFKIVEEKLILPAVSFGINDVAQFIGVRSGVPNFSANYFVISKGLLLRDWKIDTSIGYAFDINEYKSVELKGFFGGIELTPNSINKTSLNIEYDSKNINAGLKTTFFSRIILMYGFRNFNRTTFSINYILN